MEIRGAGVDEILMRLYSELPKHRVNTQGSRGAIVAEMLGLSLRLENPRARISRSENRGKPFSALGELLWYLARSDSLEFIRPYVRKYEEDAVDGILEGAYGPRLFAMRGDVDQVANVIRLLQAKPNSKRAVIQLFDAQDIATSKKEVPCTTALQFLLRNNKLFLSATMRSNDAYFGLPHDVFCFTMLQEMVATRLGVEIGEYYHYAGSMHVYEGFLDQLSAYVDEGHQRVVAMPAMSKEDPFLSVDALLLLERRLRAGEALAASDLPQSSYWADLVRLLQVHWLAQQEGAAERLEELRAEFTDPVYRTFVDSRRQLLRQPRAHGAPG